MPAIRLLPKTDPKLPFPSNNYKKGRNENSGLDNETATREITALYHLARLIFKEGEHERASVYVHQALEDVNFYGTRLRKVEINDILPIIEQDRFIPVRRKHLSLVLSRPSSLLSCSSVLRVLYLIIWLVS